VPRNTFIRFRISVAIVTHRASLILTSENKKLVKLANLGKKTTTRAENPGIAFANQCYGNPARKYECVLSSFILERQIGPPPVCCECPHDTFLCR
jgi:hypothetical protein